jgi:CBS domain-containing protein
MPDPVVRAYMHEGVVSCTPDTPLEEVAERMRGHHVSALVVVDGGVAVGVISQTDLVSAAFVRPYMRYWRGMTARHVMSSPVATAAPETSLGEAMRLLRRRRIHRLVVTESDRDGTRPIGILSMTDIIAHLAGVGAEVEPEA